MKEEKKEGRKEEEKEEKKENVVLYHLEQFMCLKRIRRRK